MENIIVQLKINNPKILMLFVIYVFQNKKKYKKNKLIFFYILDDNPISPAIGTPVNTDASKVKDLRFSFSNLDK